MDIVRWRCRNVKHWHPGGVRLRWAVAGMLSAERQFHRLNGYRQLSQLSASLAKLTGADQSELAATDRRQAPGLLTRGHKPGRN